MWFLMLLCLPLLSLMLLLELLRLLGVTLFHLLFLRVIVILLGRLLVFFFLLLLKLLVLLRLLGSQFVLLLLIFFVSCGIASVRRRRLVRLQVAGVAVGLWRGFRVVCRTISRIGASFIRRTCFVACSTGRRSLVSSASLFGGYSARLEVSGFNGSCDRRFAFIRGGT